MFGSLNRTLLIQAKKSKDIVFFAGCGYLAFGTDHLFFRRTLYKLHSLGLYHDNLNLTATIHTEKY
jgi:hypothetical protein